MSLAASIRAIATWTHTKTPTDQLTVGQFSDVEDKKTTFTNGSGVKQVNLIHKVESKTLVAGATLVLDFLDASTFPDFFGDDQDFKNIKGILIFNESDILGTTAILELDVRTKAMQDAAGNAIPIVVQRVGAGAIGTPDEVVIPIEAGGFFAVSLPQVGIAITDDDADAMVIKNVDGAQSAQVSLWIIGDNQV